MVINIRQWQFICSCLFARGWGFFFFFGRCLGFFACLGCGSVPAGNEALHKGMWERFRRVKENKLVGWNKDNLRGKTESLLQAKQNNSLFLWAGVQPYPWKSGPHHMQWLLGKMSTVTPNIPTLPSYFPRFICWTWHQMIWNIPVASWSQLSQLCSLPSFLRYPSLLAVEKQKKALKLCKCHSAITKTSLYNQPSVQHKSRTQPHSNHWKKINSAPDKISTVFFFCVFALNGDQELHRWFVCTSVICRIGQTPVKVPMPY